MAHIFENKFVAKSISQLYLNSELSDIHFVFRVHGQIVEVPANKAILAIASPVFNVMFFGPMKESKSVEIVDADPGAFAEFLQFFYMSKVTLTLENMEMVSHLADKYDMLDHFNACVTAFFENQLDKNDIVWGYQMAIMINNPKLKRFCENRIQLFTRDALKSDAFLQCDREMLEHILRLETLCCVEVELFNACIEWAKSSCRANGLDENNSNDLKSQLGDCFGLIRFGTMLDEELGNILSNKLYEGLFTREELAEILRAKTMKNYIPGMFKHTQRLLPEFKWNNDRALICYREQSNANSVFLKNRESTWFSSNAPLLLGKVDFTVIKHRQEHYFDMMVKIHVVEHCDGTFAKSSAGKIVSTTTLNFTSVSIPSEEFGEPILIYPNKMYEIQLEMVNVMKKCHYKTWKSEVKLDEKVTIKFHQNPNDHFAFRRGLVSALHFNRVLISKPTQI